jgi:hypothetical protein
MNQLANFYQTKKQPIKKIKKMLEKINTKKWWKADEVKKKNKKGLGRKNNHKSEFKKYTREYIK